MRLDDDALAELLDDLGVELDLAAVASDLEPLVHALVGSSNAKITKAAAKAAEAVWDDDVRDELAEELAQLRAAALERLETIDAAVRELEQPASRNEVARALAFHAAVELISHANRNYDRLAELETRLADASPDDRRPLALPLAVAAATAVAIPADEADEASAKFIESFPREWQKQPQGAQRAAHWLARTLDRDERRQRMREALARLAQTGDEEFPRATAALDELLGEPVPEDPADDDLWVNLCVGVVQERLARIGFDDEWPDEPDVGF